MLSLRLALLVIRLLARLLSLRLALLVIRLLARLLPGLFAGLLSLFITPFALKSLFEFPEFALGKLEGFGFVSKDALGSFLNPFLKVIEFALGTIAQSLASFIEISFTQLIDEFLFFGFVLHDLFQATKQREVRQGLLFFAEQG